METVENAIIRQKINSVTGLPHAYTPNLESKWDLLEAGLTQKERRSTGFYLRYITGIAAALLLIGGAGLYIVKNNKPAVEPAAPYVQQTLPFHDAPVASVVPAAEKKTAEKRKTVNRINKPAPSVRTGDAKQEITLLPDSFVEPVPVALPQPLLAGVKKIARFVELDFNEHVITDQAPSPVVVESKRFRFRIGSGNESNAGVMSGPSSFRLMKALN